MHIVHRDQVNQKGWTELLWRLSSIGPRNWQKKKGSTFSPVPWSEPNTLLVKKGVHFWNYIRQSTASKLWNILRVKMANHSSLLKSLQVFQEVPHAFNQTLKGILSLPTIESMQFYTGYLIWVKITHGWTQSLYEWNSTQLSSPPKLLSR